MKKLSALLIAATALAGAAGFAAPAAADRVVVHETTTVHHESGWHRKHRVCTTRWYRHRRVRRCDWR